MSKGGGDIKSLTWTDIINEYNNDQKWLNVF